MKKSTKDLLKEIIEEFDELDFFEEEEEEEDECFKYCWGECNHTAQPEQIYNKRDFIKLIMDIGASRYKRVDMSHDYEDRVYKSVARKLDDSLKPNVPYFVVRRQDSRIAIAAPDFIMDAKNTVAKALGIIPEIFGEVSGPMSTVLIIDCEKEWLRKQYLGIGEDEWLL